MNNIGQEEQMKIMDDIDELARLNALLGIMQTAFAEGGSLISYSDAASALYHIHTNQKRILKQLTESIEGVQ